MTTVSDTHARPATDGSSGPGPTDPAGATPTQQRETSRWLPTLTAAGAVALSSLSLSPLLGDGGWLGWPLLALVAITVTGGLLSGPRTPPLLVPVVQAAVGLAVLVLAFVPDAPWGLVPSPDALGELRQALQDGLADVNQFAPPVPITTGLLALLTLGVGVCALATHVLAVTLRMPVLAGAPLAAMYAVPASVLPDGAPWWSFVFVVLGWLAILLADSRLQVGAWGRVVPRGRDATTRIGSTAWTGPALRLGSLAVLLALVIPPLVPGLTDAVLGGHGEGGTSAGGDADPDAISLDPFVSLRRDLLQARDVEVFAYDTPTDQPAYLRTVVADSFDGERWIPISYSPDKSLALADATVRPPGLGPDVAATPVPYQFTSVRLSTPYLPLPYPVASVFAEGDWHWDTDSGVAFSTTDSTARTTWQVSALDVEPTVSQLEAVRTPVNDTRDRVGNTLQTRIPDSLTAQAREVTAGLTTPYAQALALQWWFRDEFTYSTEVRGDPSADQLTEFLKDRIGYCQQFAATMALMARSLNIQARVAVGFTPGTRGADGRWHVSTRDAHAWPELFFSGVGWVRFEPTPRAASDGGDVAVPRWGRADELQRIRDNATASPGPEPSAAATAPDASAAADGTTGPEPFGDRLRRTSLLVLLLIALAIAATPAVIRVRRRRTRMAGSGAALAEGGWAELRDTVRDLGGTWSDADTPRQAAARLLRRDWGDDAAAAAVLRLARATERARYAPAGDAETRQVGADVQRVRSVMSQRVEPSVRWRARLLPPTVLRRF